MVKVSTPFGFWFYIVMLAIFGAVAYPVAGFPFGDKIDPATRYEHVETFLLGSWIFVGYMACAVFCVRWIDERLERKKASKETGVTERTSDG